MHFMTLTAQRPDVFQAISDPTRRGLLDLLREGEQPVKALAEPFAMSRPAVSQHLRILLDAGLVIERRVGRERRYRLEAGGLREVNNWLQQYEKFWREKLSALGRYLDEQAALDQRGL
jgi:DNA-binding transcriptional ArsR family regulator